ncbi:phage tail fiber protein [Klebsiella pneumoniae]|uniref:phage tail fiber protein n=1 Tax=Klebsiella pneumoniae TaxID=573 RepID=UPI00351D2FD0
MAITDTQQSAQFAASAAVSAAEAKQYALSIEKPIIDIAESVSEAKDAAVVAGLARDEAKDIASGLSASIDFELAAKEAEFESQMQGQRTAFEVSQQDKESDFLSSQSQREADFVESQTDRENRFQTFLDSSGYVFLGDYENGPFQFSARNQYIRYNNQYYRLNAATDVGFTTTGTDANSFANDVTHFVLMDGDTLRQNLGSSDGLGLVGQCSSLADLRGVEFLSTGQQIFLKEHTAGQSAGGGIWYCHAMTSDGSYVDDNGCQIINSAGQVIRRKDVKELTSSYFGLQAGDTIDPVLLNMYKASRTFNIYEAKIENPGFDKGYVVQGGLRFYCGDKPFYIRSYSVGTLRGPMLYHTGDNVASTFTRFKTDGTSQEFWTGGGITGFRFCGAASYLVEGNTGVDATPVRLSDMWGGEACDLWIIGYTGNTNGAAVSLYNEFAWTEGCRVENVMVRKSMRGITFLRNHGTTATDSFFRTVVDLSFQAGVPGKSTQVMVVGDGTLEGQCVVYGHDIKLTQWMSKGAWHDLVVLEDYSVISEDGVIKLVADGYGISKTTVPSTEVVHQIKVRGLNARFRSRVENWSNQAGGWGLDFLNIIFQSNMYTNAMPFFESDFDALPTINPVGMKIRFNGTFTVDERQSGKVYTLNGLIPGMTLKVKLTSREGNDIYNVSVQEWKVFVRSTDFPCIVVPMSGSANIATTDGLALVTPAGATATFLKTVTPTQARDFVSQSYGLTVKNANDDNSTAYAVNSGRKIRFILPANPTATTTSPYSVEIEVL